MEKDNGAESGGTRRDFLKTATVAAVGAVVAFVSLGLFLPLVYLMTRLGA